MRIRYIRKNKLNERINMIIVNMTGGLGNQLFQYAFARQLQKKICQDIELNIYELERYDQKRKFSLSNYQLNQKVRISNKKLPWYVHRRNYFGKILRRISADLYFRIAKKFGAYVWYGEEYQEIGAINSKNVYLGGYWQSEKYSLQVVKDLKKELVIKEQLDVENNDLIKKIKSSNSVCVHIRRGDYIGTDYEVCSVEYYKTAISELSKVEENIELFIFSDDINWAKQNFDTEFNINYIDKRNTDYIDLYLMSQCNHFIISNSTFSWWAQYLGDYPYKKIYAPSKWHKNNNCEKIYMSEWNIINVELQELMDI